MSDKLTEATVKMRVYLHAYRQLCVYTKEKRMQLQKHLRTRTGGLRGFIERDRAGRRALIDQLMRSDEMIKFPTFDELLSDPMPKVVGDAPLACVTLLRPYLHNH
jgi:hypothetical protein